MSLSHPAGTMTRLAAIEMDLAESQNDYEQAAFEHYRKVRDREKQRAEEFIRAEGTVEARRAQSIVATSHIGLEEEARYEALRARMRVLAHRASIGQSILRAQQHSEPSKFVRDLRGSQ